ncbi:hypothetical protein RHGRI_016193 [Rhododendron griersonianum]|uniref:Uncharacterized protein n=1 Tax=Rhododendron griersonianum TaxID=479676 RepID=A0AAV6JSJ0_9ERIC|nr:hypothetical protein RHGRI_016193 [Rhododendron griersonianum]
MASSTISVTRSAAFRAASDCDPRMRSSSFATVREFWRREGAVPLDTEGNTILHFLAMYGNAFVIQKLVDDENSNKSSSSGIEKCEDLLWRNDMGNTPLHEAARFGRKSVVEILLRKQESLARERNSLGETPVYVAAACGHEDVYDHLIAKVDRHPEIMTRSTDNSNLLHAAVMGEHYDLVGLLGRSCFYWLWIGGGSDWRWCCGGAIVYFVAGGCLMFGGDRWRMQVVVWCLGRQQVVVWCSSGGGGGFGGAVGLLGAARAGVGYGGAPCGGVVGLFSGVATGACSPGSWDGGGSGLSHSMWSRLVVDRVAVKVSRGLHCCI